MKRIACILATCLAAATAHGARPEITVQIADERDAAGLFINWQTLTVTWDETPYGMRPDPVVTTTSALQRWIVPADPEGAGEYYKFSFVRNVVGEYAIRVCFGTPDANTLWSEVSVAAIARPKPPTPH